MYKVKHNLSENCLNDLFGAVNATCNLGSQSDLRIPNMNTVVYGAIQLGILGK